MRKLQLFISIILLFQTISYSQDSTSVAEVNETIKKLHENKEIFPVVIYGDSIFNVYEKAGSKSKMKQVKLCQRRFTDIMSHDFYHKEELAITDSAEYLLITYEGNTVFEFSDVTAKKLNRGKALIADKYVEKIGEYFDRIQPIVLKKKAILVLEYLGIYLAILFLIIMAHRFTKKWVLKNHNFISRVMGILRIYNLEEEERENATNNLLKVIKWIYGFGIAFYTYIALPSILDIFYLTRAKGERMINYVVDPFLSFIDGFLDFFPSLIKIIVIIFIFRTFLKVVNYFFDELEKGNVNIP
ncbi:MAG: hypothetical protein KAG37_11375, partial [Flavobacteriales bacterium]|nr:hypothetical protein [Flavobacteriales bacterium]